MSKVRVDELEDGFDLLVAGRLVPRHRTAAPAFLGSGRAHIETYRGNFEIEDQLNGRIALRAAIVSSSRILLSPAPGEPPLLTISMAGDTLHFAASDPTLNRFWMRTFAETGERLWGGGEQMSYFDLAGRRFPLWTIA